MKKRVEKTHKIQKERFSSENIHFNSHMNHKHIKKYCGLCQDAKDLLKAAMENMHFSARAYDKILKVSRTIADTEESEIIQAHHVSEAINYRSLDRNFWV
ncbi:MAG: ATP-binding protein [Candidatus Omnitrophica bacterium]|nr:ATP-binding protein [Candidatus Omnitrophota bacterium]